MRYLTPVLRVALTAGLAASALVACTDTPERTTAPLPGGPSFASGSNAGANLDQWANGKTPPTGESWQNGNLNGNNSAYAEGRAVPFRLAIEAGVPVLPIAVAGTRHAMAKGSFRFRRAHARCVVLEPIDTAGMTLTDVADLRERTKSAIEAAKLLPQDVRKTSRALQVRIPDSGCARCCRAFANTTRSGHSVRRASA